MKTVKATLTEGNKSALAFILVCCVSLMGLRVDAEPVTGTWIGNSSYKLIDETNWLNRIRPGRYKEKDGVGNVVTNGDFGGTMIFSNESIGWGIQLVTENFVSISNMVFRGDAIKQFYYPDWGSNQIYLEPGGRYEVEESAGKVPYFQAGGSIWISGLTETNQYIDIINNSLNGTLKIGSLHNTKKVSGQLRPRINFGGQGDIEIISGAWSPSQYTPGESVQMLVLKQTGNGKLVIDTSANLFFWGLVVPASETERMIEINQGKTLRLAAVGDAAADLNMDVDADLKIVGVGKINIGYDGWSSSYINIASGKTLTMGAGLEASYGGGTKGYVVHGGGTLVFNASCTNKISGTPMIEYSSKVRTPVIGDAGSTTSPLGAGTTVALSEGGRLVYTGPGETASRNFQIRWGSTMHLEQAGTGPLEITGRVAPTTINNVTLDLVNDTAFDGTLAGEVADDASGKKLSIEKTGTGVWRINCAASYTGGTAIKAGTLAIGADGSLENSAVTANGGTLAFEGDSGTAEKTINSLTLAANAASGLTLAAGVKVTLPAITRGDNATLAVTLGDGAELNIAGFSKGITPAWMTVNGGSAMIDSNGKVLFGGSSADYSIDAHGGVVSNAEGSVVAVTTATGPVAENMTLETSPASIALLRQEQSVDDAVLKLASGQTLNTDMLYVKSGAKPLTVAVASGTATLAGNDGGAVMLATETGSELALSGALAVSSAVFSGGGTVKVDTGVQFEKIAVSGTPTLELTGDVLDRVTCEIANGTLTMAGTGVLRTEAGSMIRVGTNGTGKLVVDGAKIIQDDLTSCNSRIEIGRGVGTLEVLSGSVVTNFIQVGPVGTDEAAYVQKGGTVCNLVPGSSWSNIVNTFFVGSAYGRLEGGDYVEKGVTSWGGSPSQVIFEQTGGIFYHNGQTVLGGWDTQLSVYLSGGTFKIDGSVEFPGWNAGNNWYSLGDRLNYVLTVDGTAECQIGIITMGRIKSSLAYTENAKANPAMMNICGGGVLKIGRFCREGGYLRSDTPTSRAFVNFDGGTLRMTMTECPFGIPEARRRELGSGAWGIDRVTVFEGGCTFDTDGRSVTAYMPFDEPTGNGIASVPLPVTVAAKTFTAPPAVVIFGDGEGASAHPVFDRTTGKVTGVKVLSPGWGYTAATAHFSHGGTTFRADSTCVLKPVSGGMLTKVGAGTYTLSCTNSVRSLKVTGGTLAQGVDDAFPSDTVLTLDGGIYDLGGKRQTFANVLATGVGGSVTGGTLSLPRLTFDLRDAIAGKTPLFDAAVSFAVGATITVENAAEVSRTPGSYTLATFSGGVVGELPRLSDETLEALPRGWKLALTGNRLVLFYPAGTTVIFR